MKTAFPLVRFNALCAEVLSFAAKQAASLAKGGFALGMHALGIHILERMSSTEISSKYTTTSLSWLSNDSWRCWWLSAVGGPCPGWQFLKS